MDAQPGKWYYGFRCKKCDRLIPFQEDPSAGKNPVQIAGPGKLNMICPYPDCGQPNEFGAGELESMQAHAKAPDGA